MVSYKALNTKAEASTSQTCDGVGNSDAGQSRASPEALFSQTCDGVWNGDAGQARAIPEAPISQTCNYVALFCSFVIYYLALI